MSSWVEEVTGSKNGFPWAVNEVLYFQGGHPENIGRRVNHWKIDIAAVISFNFWTAVVLSRL
jgi:hypothetical protein